MCVYVYYVVYNVCPPGYCRSANGIMVTQELTHMTVKTTKSFLKRMN